MKLERGSLINNRYRIVEILGQGGMGSVYQAIDENLGVEVAVKDNLITTEEYARQFHREATILANLRHPNLPRVTDHFVISDQGQFLVMDYIEGEDFREDPPKKYFRLSPGREVRLKHAYYITCEKVIKDEKTGEIIELHCTYDPESRGGWTPDNRRVKGTLHWVSAQHAVKVEIRLYDHLFTKEDPEEVEEGKTFMDNLNPNSLEVLTGCLAEPGLAEVKSGDLFQFMRQGYFSVDPDSESGKPVFNRAVSLRDTWAKIEQKMKK